MKTVLICLLAFALGIPMLFAQDYMKEGDACYNKRDYACALNHYLKAVETNMSMNKALVYFRIGYSMNRLSKNEEAKKWLLQALHEGQKEADWSLAEAHFNTQKYDSAAYYFEMTFKRSGDKGTKLSTAYGAANSYSIRGLYKDALKWLNEVLTLEPADLPSLELKGRIEMTQGDPAGAEKSYRAAIAVSSDTATLRSNYYQLARTLYQQEKFQEAIPMFRTVLFYDPSNINGFAGIADSYKGLKRIDSAGFYYDKGIASEIAGKKKTDSAAIVRVANASVRMYLRETKDTVATLTKYLPNLIKYEQQPSIVPELMNTVMATNNLKLIETVVPLYIANQKLRNRNSDAASWEVKLANAYTKAKQGAKATAIFRDGMLTSPTDKLFLKAYVNGLIEEKKLKVAIDTLRKRSPNIKTADMSDLMLLEAHLLYLLKDTVASAKICREVLQLNTTGRPYDFAYNANFLMGQMALQRKDSVTAYNYWDRIRAISLGKTESLYNEYELHYLMGIKSYSKAATYTGYLAATNYKTAADHFKKALSFDSSKPVTRLYQGSSLIMSNSREAGKQILEPLVTKYYSKKKDTAVLIYHILGRGETSAIPPAYQAALVYFNKAIELAPSDTAILYDIGATQYALKEYTEAIKTFTKLTVAYKSTANQAAAYYNRSLCHYLNKSKALAMADVEKALALTSNYPDAKKLKDMIEKLTE